MSLERILDLPLQPDALAVVWREILQHQSVDADSSHQHVRQQILAALHELEFNRAVATCRRGDWSTGLSLLEAAMQTCDFPTMMAPILLEILPNMHHQLINLAEEDPSRCPFCDDERAELLWLSALWLRRLNDQGIEQPDQMAAIHEQIYRYGALAWMAFDSALAHSRSLILLLILSEINPEAHSWTWPACRDRISAQLQVMEERLIRDQSPGDLVHDLDELVKTIEWFADVFSSHLNARDGSNIDSNNVPFRAKLATAKACLLVWQKLKSDS